MTQTLRPAGTKIFTRWGRRPFPMAAPLLNARLQQPRNDAAPPSFFPEIIVPGVGVAQVVLRNWFRVTTRDMEVVGDDIRPIVRVRHFRLLLTPTTQFWSYRAGATNRVPPNAVIVYG